MSCPGRLVVAVLTAATVGCGSPPVSRSEATLVAALGSDPGHLNPAITTNGSVHSAAGLLFNGLLTLDSLGRPAPELARRWDVEAGGALYRFHLRRDVRWHDDRPFTAHDVTFTFDDLLLRYHARTRASLAPVLVSVDAPDDSTVEFRFREPYAPLLQQLDVVEAPILPRHVYGGGDPLRHPANIAPVGSGPYRFESYRSNREITYVANPGYFGGPPAVQRVILRVIPDPGTQVMALETGEVDWLFSVPGPERRRLLGNPQVRLIQTAVNPGGSNCVMVLGFNLERPMFRDVRVRRAVALAVDREQFVDRVLFGDGRAATAPVSSRIPFAHATDVGFPPFDPAAADRLLDATGWRRTGSARQRVAHGVPGVPDGTPFVANVKLMPSQAGFGDLLRAQLRPIGIDLRVEALEPAVFAHSVFTDRAFDTAVASYCNGADPEIGVRRMFVSSSIAPVPFSNLAGYRNPTADTLFDRARAATTLDERQRLYREIQHIVARDQPYVWLVETLATRAHGTRCHGFTTASHFAASARCDP